MTNDRRVLVHPDIDSLTGSVAARFITKLIDLHSEFDVAHIVLTGGTVGTATQRAIAGSAARDSVDWSRVHFWWGDERFLVKSDPERNEVQARTALLHLLPTPEQNIHPFPAADETSHIDEAAAKYADQLAEYASGELPLPRFDITFLGVGSDGHIASLFPDQDGYRSADRLVVAVREAPKPPPDRLTLTLPALNSSARIWMVLAGADKASALGLALAGATANEVPVAGVRGRKRTVFFVDAAAAANVPQNLIAAAY